MDDEQEYEDTDSEEFFPRVPCSADGCNGSVGLDDGAIIGELAYCEEHCEHGVAR